MKFLVQLCQLWEIPTGLLLSASVLWLILRRPPEPCTHRIDLCCTRCIQRAVWLDKLQRIGGLTLLIVIAIGAMVALSMVLDS